ncbi:hypothetical protein SLOPH_1143 [Spraguea lophii 42_110]|uniref:Uncharacterized protein n=1 Tax=Spraguea lophii (strain 42_110) TaxID=1358809 RepID=S7W9P0_SPRLO|nr:hypothetical protein SLOPH_1143 [Spraguea lophii 42_110]
MEKNNTRKKIPSNSKYPQNKLDPLLHTKKTTEPILKLKKEPIRFKKYKTKEDIKIPKLNSFWKNRRKEIMSLEDRIAAIPKEKVKVNINNFIELQKRFEERNKNLHLKLKEIDFRVNNTHIEQEDKIIEQEKNYNKNNINDDSSEDEFEM